MFSFNGECSSIFLLSISVDVDGVCLIEVKACGIQSMGGAEKRVNPRHLP